MNRLAGTHAALVTPFRADGALDLDALAAHVSWLLSRDGAPGLMVCGTTGESALLEPDEVIAVVRGAVAAAAGAVPVIAHVGRPATAATIRLGERALEAGADAISAVVPYYFPLSAEQIRAHYEALLDAFPDAPVLAYNIPGHTGNDLAAEDLGALLEHGLAGLKDSTKSLERHEAYIAAAQGRDVALLSGSDTLLAAARRAGGNGSITAMANVRPELVAAVHAAADAGDWEAAEAAQRELEEAREAMPGGGTARSVKRALAARVDGYPDAVRAPL